MASSLGSSWHCPSCGVRVPDTANVCMCLRARPPEANRFPQIFRFLTFHFNGIIPRTLRHPSHAVEWRMAEAHGATCVVDFDSEIDRITHLIYRPGYERSDKVRQCIAKYNKPCMPINWMLDSMLQSRQLHESLYRLTEVPLYANGVGPGGVLQHQQHPFFVANHDVFELRSTANDSLTAPLGQSTGPSSSGNNASMGGVSSATARRFGDPPPDLPPIPAVVHRLAPSNAWPEATRANSYLFNGMVFAFAGPSSGASIPQLALCVKGRSGSFTDDLRRATHLVFHGDDKKGPTMVQAAIDKDAGRLPGLRMASLTWLQDSVWLDEVLPCVGEYAPSDKLLQTLRKRAAKGSGALHQDPSVTA